MLFVLFDMQEDISQTDDYNSSYNRCSPLQLSDDNTLKLSVRKRLCRRKPLTDVNCNSVEQNIPTAERDSKDRDRCDDSVLASSSMDDSFQSSCAVLQFDEISNSISSDVTVLLNSKGSKGDGVTSNDIGPIECVLDHLQSEQAFLNGDLPQSDPEFSAGSIPHGDHDVRHDIGLNDASLVEDVCSEAIELNSLSIDDCDGSNLFGAFHNKRKGTQRELGSNDADSNSSTACSSNAFKYSKSEYVARKCDSTEQPTAYPTEVSISVYWSFCLFLVRLLKTAALVKCDKLRV